MLPIEALLPLLGKASRELWLATRGRQRKIVEYINGYLEPLLPGLEVELADERGAPVSRGRGPGIPVLPERRGLQLAILPPPGVQPNLGRRLGCAKIPLKSKFDKSPLKKMCGFF